MKHFRVNRIILNAHDAENWKMMVEIFRADARKTIECHSCGERQSHVVRMFNPDDPEARGRYCSNCRLEKRKDGWRVE